MEMSRAQSVANSVAISEKTETLNTLDMLTTRLLQSHDGGEGTEKMRIKRAEEPHFYQRVNAYWGYTLLSLRGRPFPIVPLIVYAIYVSAVVAGVTYGVISFSNGEEEVVDSLEPKMKDTAQILGLAVFLILTFRNNSAYQRWYDGSVKYYELCGAVTNAARQVAAVSPPESALKLLWWLVAVLYAAKEQLRKKRNDVDFSLFADSMPDDQYEELLEHVDKFQWCLFRYGQTAAKIDLPGKTEGKACEEVMKAATQIQAAYTACWRILRTPMPFAYLAHLRTFLCLWLALLPWVFVHSYAWYTLILTTLVCYGVLGIEEAAVEVEQPFGHDRNDLPLDYISQDTFRQLFEYLCHSTYDKEGVSLTAPKGSSCC